ncbi:MAG: 3-deoxy-7-phosphoheptulonate synthase [Myxococcales bacterium]|nr:3-deoxy-7-phosphoheptulonate synthase [Myxococcales bacterium]USN51703.1 MAG: 3-deoxy-7-phosphoheptulonate synthase [Myxococcales bacterium]
MIIILKQHATKEDADTILEEIEKTGLKPLFLPGVERIVIGAIGDERLLNEKHFENFPQVEQVKPVLSPYKMVSREFSPASTIVKIGNVEIGGDNFVTIAGPCAIENTVQMNKVAQAVKSAGAKILRGGAFKPRTSPYSFQGLGVEGLKILASTAKEYQIPTVTEVIETADIDAVEEYADAFQVGARNMQNFSLLKELGQRKKPVILKRGLAAKVEDLLLAAEYILSKGNSQVILCERGIRTFETCTRNTLDLNAVPYLKATTHLPVIVDPSHGTGVRDLVAPMAYAAAACGADGVIIEVHHDPKIALSDGKQSLFPEQFSSMMQELRKFVQASGRTM